MYIQKKINLHNKNQKSDEKHIAHAFYLRLKFKLITFKSATHMGK